MRITRNPLRRQTLAILTTLTMSVSACATDTGQSPENGTEPVETDPQPEASGQIVFSSWGGDYSETWKQVTDQFTEETGIEVVFDDAPAEHLAQLQAQVEAENIEWDLIEFGFAEMVQANEADMLQTLPEEIQELAEEHYQPGWFTDVSLAAGGGLNNVIACLEEVDPCPTNAAEWWDIEAFPGERAMWRDGALSNIIMALDADGVELTMDSLFPLDFDRAFQKLDEVKPHVAVWWTTGDQSQQLLRDGEVDMNLGWDGRMAGLEEQGFSVQLSPAAAVQEPGNHLAIPNDAPNAAGALAFLEWFVQRPEMGATLAEGTGYPGPHADVGDFLDPDQANRVYLYRPGIEDQVFTVEATDYLEMGAENISEIEARYFEWFEG